MPAFNLRFTNVASLNLEDQVHHLSIYHGNEAALGKVGALIDLIVARLTSTPFGYPVSHQLSELGIVQYRELNTEGYRILYEVLEADIVVGLVIRQKQSVEQALIRYCLLNPL